MRHPVEFKELLLLEPGMHLHLVNGWFDRRIRKNTLDSTN
jgi:hypothetical protein